MFDLKYDNYYFLKINRFILEKIIINKFKSLELFKSPLMKLETLIRELEINIR